MSQPNSGNNQKKSLGFRFMRKKSAGESSNGKESLSFDDLESLGMESGTRSNNVGRFFRRGNRRPSVDSKPDVIMTRPDVITTRARSKSDELSFDGSSFPDSASGVGASDDNGGKTLRGLRRFMGKTRRARSNTSDAAPSDLSEKSSSHHPPAVSKAESFDSGDNMLKYVKDVDPNISYKRGNRARPAGRGGRRADFDVGGYAGGQSPAAAPIKRISFEPGMEPSSGRTLTDLSQSLVTQGGAPDGEPLVTDTATYSQSVVTQATYSTTQTTQTYRSMGGSDIGTERARYSVHEGSRASKKKFRVRPYHSFQDPVHMTEEEIYNDSTKPSLHCEMLKSYLAPSTKAVKSLPVKASIREKYGSPVRDGRIGSLRCEVLGCVSLARKAKPDICAYLICGDSAFCTDVIQGYRSPMWPSVSRRAAVFPIHHAYSRLYAGVFDVRSRKNKENDVFCGRVCIDIASLRPNTEYDVTLPLRHSSFVYERHKRGVVRLRFSLHWYSERAAVLSYFKNPKTAVESCPLEGGCPTIPCADPKTFRNVAVTVHGSDLPGKYSKLAFKSTVREFQLYQLNIRYLTWYLMVDTVFYEKPYISLYVFLAGMHCILTESVTKVPPYVMGFIIILCLENYKHYVSDATYNEGYQQLTLLEVFKALLSKPGSRDRFFEPILVNKRAKRRANRRGARNLRRIHGDANGFGVNADDEDEPLDHKEFPLSDREMYPKLDVENALAPSKSKGGGHTRLHGRLSVYYAPVDNDDGGDDDADDDDDDSSDDSDGAETVMEGAGLYDSAFDLDDIDDDDDGGDHRPAGGGQYGYGDSADGDGKGRIRRLIHSAQDIDDAGGAAVPAQVTVKRVENMFHKRSYSVAVEKVVVPPSKEQVRSAQMGQSELTLSSEQIEKQIDQKRKAYLDEFDKLLGLQSRSANPINRIMATFLGPLMRVLRIPVFIFRIGFNAYTWRDPYMSFWVFCSLLLALLVLMAFPWRLFFFLAILGGVGPQNVLLRKYLEKRAKKRKEEEEEKARQQEYDGSVAGSTHSSQYGYGDTSGQSSVVGNSSKKYSTAMESDNASVKSNEPARRGFFGRKKRGSKTPQADAPSEFFAHERPPFSSDHGSNTNRKALQPRSVVVPYSKLRKERFYDWPPDPTVSRATPLEFETWQPEPEEIPTKDVANSPRRTSMGNLEGSPTSAEQELRRRRGSL